MRLLFDHNLSPQLVKRLADIFPSSDHVYRIKLEEATDLEVCKFAQSNGFTVVTKDADYELISLQADAPSIVWIRRGNCSTSEIEVLLRDHADQIFAFGEHETAQLLILL